MAKRVRNGISAMLLTILLAIALAAPAALAEDHESRERAEEMAREGMERIMRALEMFMGSIPQYELPEVNEHGDIIIRRKRNFEEPEPKAPKEEPDAAET